MRSDRTAVPGRPGLDAGQGQEPPRAADSRGPAAAITAEGPGRDVLPALFGPVAAVADAILYEGYLLYPYRLSSAKNKVRWQFGVLLPRAWAEAHGLDDTGIAGSAESWWQQTECLLAAPAKDAVHVRVRFLQLQRRMSGPRTATQTAPGFDEAVPREADITASLDDLLRAESVINIDVPDGCDVAPAGPGNGEAGPVIRRREAVSATVTLSARACGPDGLLRLRVRVENAGRGPDGGASREAALGRALIATHTLLAAPGGEFVSLVDPPAWAREAARGCRNVHTFPVLAGAGGGAQSCCRHRSSCTTTLRSPRRARATCTTLPRSTRSCCSAR